MPLRSYRDLVVWQRSMELAEEVYRLCGAMPRYEAFGIASQIRRASTSIPANIAEGYGREYRADYVKHLSVAQGWLAELETLVMLSVRIGHLEPRDVPKACSLSDEVGRMLTVMLKRLGSRRPLTGSRPVGPRP
jgi:four helix bundle protein